MDSHEERMRKIEDALRAAYREKRPSPVSPAWKQGVMAKVKGMDITTPRASAIWTVPVVWRTAAAMGACALIVFLYSYSTSIGPDFEAARLFLDDPLGLVLAQPLIP